MFRNRTHYETFDLIYRRLPRFHTCASSILDQDWIQISGYVSLKCQCCFVFGLVWTKLNQDFIWIRGTWNKVSIGSQFTNLQFLKHPDTGMKQVWEVCNTKLKLICFCYCNSMPTEQQNPKYQTDFDSFSVLLKVRLGVSKGFKMESNSIICLLDKLHVSVASCKMCSLKEGTDCCRAYWKLNQMIQGLEEK